MSSYQFAKPMENASTYKNGISSDDNNNLCDSNYINGYHLLRLLSVRYDILYFTEILIFV